MKDTIIPEGKWAFDQAVTDVFDDMLRRSIPEYDAMRRTCFELACRFRRAGTDIVDLGCSRGEAMAELVTMFGATNRFVGVEVSPPMLAAVRIRFQRQIRAGWLRIDDLDLRSGYPTALSSVTLSVLTLQFIPVEYRPRIVCDVYRHTVEGGAFMLVEKVLGSSTRLLHVMEEAYHALKRRNGYTEEAIQRKRLSLEGVLVPLTAAQNVDLLHAAGFREVDCFWRSMNFAGWIAVK
jgi:tRNA (cmo5U34)-methyltransferase